MKMTNLEYLLELKEQYEQKVEMAKFRIEHRKERIKIIEDLMKKEEHQLFLLEIKKQLKIELEESKSQIEFGEHYLKIIDERIKMEQLSLPQENGADKN